jgi:ABC-type xylose transport system permease subunit
MTLWIVLGVAVAIASQLMRARLRDHGWPGNAGRGNAITDVAGVTVGHTTLPGGSVGRDGVTAHALSGERVAQALAKYGRPAAGPTP